MMINNASTNDHTRKSGSGSASPLNELLPNRRHRNSKGFKMHIKHMFGIRSLQSNPHLGLITDPPIRGHSIRVLI